MTNKKIYGNIYMHTIRSRPAYFVEEQQIVYANNGSMKVPESFCSSLKELRYQQKQAAAWRKSKGFGVCNDYGYLRLKVPLIGGNK